MKDLFKQGKFDTTRNDDRKFEQIFVCKENSIYIMDNHRAALWCWVQEIAGDNDNKFALLHIDNHEDMSPAGISHCKCAVQPDLLNLSIKEHLEIKHNCEICGTIPIFSYDNFLYYFIEHYSDKVRIEDLYITMKHWDNKPNSNPKIQEDFKKYIGKTSVITSNKDCFLAAKRLSKDKLLNFPIENFEKNWILDLDLDYFYNTQSNTLNIILARKVFKLIKGWFDKKRVKVLTIAWSPEFLINRGKEGLNIGIERAENLNKEFCKIFNINFKP